MESSSALMASLKALLVSAVSIADVALRAFVPSTSADTLAALLSCFRPPCHFVIVNGIIIAITATSRCFHHPQPEAAAPRRIAVVEVVEAAPVMEAFDESKDFEEKRAVVVVEGNGGVFGGGDGYNGDCKGERKVASRGPRRHRGGRWTHRRKLWFHRGSSTEKPPTATAFKVRRAK